METKLNYKNLSKMISSTDKENTVVALQAIEHCDYKSNVVAMALLRKMYTPSEAKWTEEAPNSMRFLQDNELFNLPLTFDHIFKAIKKLKPEVDQVELFLQEFNEFTLTQLQDYGYSFIKSVNVQLEPLD